MTLAEQLEEIERRLHDTLSEPIKVSDGTEWMLVANALREAARLGRESFRADALALPTLNCDGGWVDAELLEAIP